MSPSDVLPYASLLAILAMAAMTGLIRVGGFWLMGFVPITQRMRRMLEALPGSLVAAIVLPVVGKEGLPALLAVCAVIGVMIVRRNEFVAMGLGIAVVISARAMGL